ncbi:MAG: hypothetical protein V2A70_06535, partial [Candidatus Omnitrophota bacterium]
MTRLPAGTHAILPFHGKKIRDQYLVSNLMGAWDVLGASEYRRLCGMEVDPASVLGVRLLRRGLLVDETNLAGVIQDYRNLNAHLFLDT